MSDLQTERLLLRRPQRSDVPALFDAFCADPEVTRWLSWATHQSTADTQAFIDFSDAEWHRSPVGPLLIFTRHDGELIGSSGLAFETPTRASTGYVIRKSAWGRGYATEAMTCMLALSDAHDVVRLQAICHVDHLASARVLEKSGLVFEGILRAHTVFPNAGLASPQDVRCFARVRGHR
jgi:[ribosomal protein S5]-alanine N-acetyltransferase